MNKSYYVLGLMCVVLFTACGKTTTAAKNTTNPTQNNQTAVPAGSTLIPGTNAIMKNTQLDGELMPLSMADIGDIKSVPFNSAQASSFPASNQGIGNPSFTYSNGTNSTGYIKDSNLVFRAIKAIPPLEAISKVTAMELHLKGVSLYTNGKSAADLVKSLVLCSLDSKHCTGTKPDDADKTANGDFFKTANVQSSSLVDASQLENAFWLSDAEGVYRIIKSGTNPDDSEIVIDLKKAFGITDDKGAAQWLMDNSVKFDSSYYRKFRFGMGNSIYASSGTLNVQFETIKAKLPQKFLNLQVTKPAEGESDVMLEPISKTATDQTAVSDQYTAEVKVVLTEKQISFDEDGDLTDESAKKVQALAEHINLNPGEVKRIVIDSNMDEGTNLDASKNIAQERSKSISEVLMEAQKLKTGVVVAVGESAKDAARTVTISIKIDPSMSADDIKCAATDLQAEIDKDFQ